MQFVRRNSIFHFVSGALSLNFLLFLPQFLAYRDMWKNIPKAGYPEFEAAPFLSSVLIRSHFDIFRFQCDFLFVLLIILLIASFGKLKQVLPWLLTFIFVFLFCYITYYEFSIRLYGGHPYFKNDIALALGVLPTFLSEVGFAENQHILITVIIFILGIAVIYLASRFVIHSYKSILHAKKNRILVYSIGPILLIGLIGHEYFPKSGFKNAWKTTQWTFPKIVKSINMPEKGKPHLIQQLDTYRAYEQHRLENRPNVYLYFMESYGAVPYFSSEAGPHNSFMKTMDSVLIDNGWNSCSSYSKSTIIGGRSWLGFTTAMSGLHLESQLQYNHLLENYPDYPHLTWWFNQNGYTTYRLKTMSNVKKSTAYLYRLSDSFYSFDHWIKHADFDYRGYEYDEYFGGIPDQYAMDHFHQAHLDHEQMPYFTFFISMTSHIPWHPPPPIYDNYQVLNKSDKKPHDYNQRFDQPDINRYHETIEYSLGVTLNYLTKQLRDDKNCIFIVIGDHQPPTLDYLLEDHISPFAVPIHIMSRDTSFLNSFSEYGFEVGMIPNPEKVTLNHSGLYSLLVNRLINSYGKNKLYAPEFLPSGLE